MSDIPEDQTPLSPSWKDICSFPSPTEGAQDPLAVLLQSVLENIASVQLLSNLAKLSKHLENDAEDANRMLGAIGMLKYVLVKQIDNMEVHAATFEVLSRAVEVNTECQEEAVDKGIIETIVESVRKWPAKLPVVESAFRLLKALTLIKFGREQMVEKGVLELLVDTLKSEAGKHTTTLAYVLATTGRVVFGSYEIKMKLCHLNVIEPITSRMSELMSCSDVMVEAGLALRNLAYECVPNHDRMTDVNTFSVLFEGLKLYKRNRIVLDQVLAAIANMVAMDDEAEKRVTITKVNVMELFDTLKIYSKDWEVCRKVGAVFIHMCSHDKSIGEHTRKLLIATTCLNKDVSACPAFVDAIENADNVNDMRLFVKMTRICEYLCISEKFRKEIGNAGIFNVYLNFLKKGTHEEHEADAVMSCFASILSGQDSNKVKFKELEGLTPVLKILCHPSTSEVLATNSVKVIDVAIAGQNVSIKDLIDPGIKTEVVSTVLSTLSRYRICQRIQEIAVSSLVKIASEGIETASTISRLGAYTQIEATLAAHKGNPGVESLSNQLLSMLAERKGGRMGRCTASGSGGNASARRMSRSRNVGNRAMARNGGKSLSPRRGNRDLTSGRRESSAAGRIGFGKGMGAINECSKSNSQGSSRSKLKARRERIGLETIEE